MIKEKLSLHTAPIQKCSFVKLFVVVVEEFLTFKRRATMFEDWKKTSFLCILSSQRPFATRILPKKLQNFFLLEKVGCLDDFRIIEKDYCRIGLREKIVQPLPQPSLFNKYIPSKFHVPGVRCQQLVIRDLSLNESCGARKD